MNVVIGKRRARPAFAALVFAAAASAALLSVAHGFEAWGHYPPCELCLHQREGYWTALWIAAIGMALTRVWSPAPRLCAAMLAVVFLGEGLIAAYHAGVEWKWWPGPASCTGGHATVSTADLASLMKGGTVHMVRCDQAAWRLLGMSMAGWNAIAAVGLSLVSLAAALTQSRRRGWP